MNKDKALLMAIEFMETLTIDVGIKTWNEKHRKEAIQACRQALEQPAMTYEQGFDHGYEAHRVEQELEQPAQEPVAYKHEIFINGRCAETWYDDIKNPASDTKIIPLYTHPAPSWQGLSDDEIMNIARESYMSRDGGDIKFARAIEQSMRNKNGY